MGFTSALPRGRSRYPRPNLGTEGELPGCSSRALLPVQPSQPKPVHQVHPHRNTRDYFKALRASFQAEVGGCLAALSAWP